MQKKRGLSRWLALILAGAVWLPGGLSVYAEPEETPPGEVPAYEEQPVEPPTEEPIDPPVIVPTDPVDLPTEEPSIEPPMDTDDTPTEPSFEPEISYDPPTDPVPFIPTEPSYDGEDTPEPDIAPPTQPSYVWHDEPDYTAYDNNDPYSYTQEVYGYDEDNGYGVGDTDGTTDDEPYTPPRDTSSLDISDYELSDVETLTSQDWEALKQAQQEASRFEMDPTPTANKSAFDKLKQESKGGNDDWVYLVIGIGLIVAGAAAIFAVIWTSWRTKRYRR